MDQKFRRPRSQREWFGALDGRRVRAAGKSWDVEVIGVHEAGSDFWLQLRLVGHPTRELVVQVPPMTAAEVALRMLVDAATHDQSEYRIPSLNEAA